MLRRLPALLAAAVSAAAVACSGSGSGSGDPVSRPTASTEVSAAGGMKLTAVATVEQPVAMAVRAGDPTLYFAEKTGRVRAVRDGRADPTPVLDLSGSVSSGGEQGLLGLAFGPVGGPMYVNFTDRSGDTHVVEYGFAGGKADLSTRRELLFVDQPYANHNGGNLVFGPDGMLWIGLGDGGSQGDPKDNGQSLGTLLGKLLRIDPTPSGGRPYSIPFDNPFVDTPGARPEIWALGLRNPWRYSFDRMSGDLWIGDVGANAREEVDFVAAGSKGGANFGWARLEGTRRQSGSPPAGAVAPVVEYPTGDGTCSVTGGYVYRGARIPALVGSYLFGDYCAGAIQVVSREGGKVTEPRGLGLTVASLTSFGEADDGELYALSLHGKVFRIDPT
ncbi:MAG: PQQ-dependent sugar dehydrogenase [Acidimicrobiales bacterium]